jgi:hypothetical protein
VALPPQTLQLANVWNCYLGYGQRYNYFEQSDGRIGRDARERGCKDVLAKTH